MSRRFLAPMMLILVSALAAPAWGQPSLDKLFPGPAELATAKFDDPPRLVRVPGEITPEMPLVLPLPLSTWRRVATPIGSGTLAAFVSPEGVEGGLVEVLVHELSVEVNPADWLLAALVRNGGLVLRTRVTPSALGPVFEALATAAQTGENRPARIVRAAVHRSGSRLFVVRAQAVEPAFSALADRLGVSVLQFRLNQVQPVQLVGSWRKHCFLNGLCYVGPAVEPVSPSWSPRPIQEHVFDLAQAGRVTGRLAVRTLSPPESDKAGPAEMIRGLIKALRAKGVRMTWDGGGLTLMKTRLPGGACYYRARGVSPQGEAELFALASSHQRVGLLAWLVTLGQLTDLPAWMANKRVFEVLGLTLDWAPRG